MKLCKNCQAAYADELEVCPVCGEVLEEQEPQVEEPVEEIVDVTPVEEETQKAKKSYFGLIAIIVLVVLLIAAFFFGKSIYDKKQAEKEPAQQPALEEPGEAPSQEPGQELPEGEALPGHHINAYGLPSHSIHFTVGADGAYTYDYQNENGDTVALTPEEAEALMDQEVASAAGKSLTNRQLMYFYDEQYYNFYSQFSSYLSFMMDPSLALDEQVSMDGVNSWQQTFVDSGINLFHQSAVLRAAAEQAGFAMDAAEKEKLLAAAVEDLEGAAAQYGFPSSEAYLQVYYGPAASLDGYLDFYGANVDANAYVTSLVEAMEISDGQIEAYYDENAEELQASGLLKVDKPVIDVRHILVTPESTTDEEGNTSISDEAWAAAEAEAQKIYDEWKNGRATEDTFGELAQENTDDPGSLTNGGLYKDVFPGQMVPEFNDWCFADGRKTGDSGIVKTSYGYHIMYFVNQGEDIYWRLAVKDMIAGEMLSDEIANLQRAEPLTVDYTKAILLTDMAPTIPGAAEEPAE